MKELEFKDLPEEMQEAASFILGKEPEDGKLLAMADILFALHTFKETVMLGKCHCGELGPEIRKGAPILCPKHDKEWPFCQVSGCRNKTGGQGFCSPHKKLHEMAQADTEIRLSNGEITIMSDYIENERWKS